jgi:hypothetical protein
LFRTAWAEVLRNSLAGRSGIENGPGVGVEEAAPPWADQLCPEKVDGCLDDVLAGARRFLVGPAIDLDAVPDVSSGLIHAGIGPGEFGWLHRMWQDKPAAWLARWPLLGHIGSHVGEMIATRNRIAAELVLTGPVVREPTLLLTTTVTGSAALGRPRTSDRPRAAPGRPGR